MPNRESNNARGQSTVEFALVAPLVLTSSLLLVAVTVVCVQLIQLHDVARMAVRAAATSQMPQVAAESVVQSRSVQLRLIDDPTTGIITVQVTRTSRVPLIGSVLQRIGLSATASMMKEAPPVLSR